MKKIFKSRLFFFILGIILTMSIVGVSASILYNASEVGFTPTDPNWNVNNLEDALNDLYTNKGNIDDYADKTYTQEGLSIYSNRVTILEGGYYVDDSGTTWVNLKLKSNTNITEEGNWILLYGLPASDKIMTIVDTSNKYAFKFNYPNGNSYENDIVYPNFNDNIFTKDTEFTLQFKY